MVNRGNNLPIKWIVLVLLCLATIGFWTHRPGQNVSGPVSSSKPSALQAQQNASPVEGISKEENLSKPNALASKQAENTSTSNQQNSTLQQVDNASQSSSSGSNQTGSSGSNNQNKTVTSVPVNPIPTQAQIVASINFQNQQRQVLNQVLSDRTKQIDNVHQAILDSGVQNSSDQAKPFVAPLVTPPDDIAQKLKSHQLVGH